MRTGGRNRALEPISVRPQPATTATQATPPQTAHQTSHSTLQVSRLQLQQVRARPNCTSWSFRDNCRPHQTAPATKASISPRSPPQQLQHRPVRWLALPPPTVGDGVAAAAGGPPRRGTRRRHERATCRHHDAVDPAGALAGRLQCKVSLPGMRQAGGGTHPLRLAVVASCDLCDAHSGLPPPTRSLPVAPSPPSCDRLDQIIEQNKTIISLQQQCVSFAFARQELWGVS